MFDEVGACAAGLCAAGEVASGPRTCSCGGKLENLTRSGKLFVPGSGAWWTNGLDGSDGSDFTL